MSLNSRRCRRCAELVLEERELGESYKTGLNTYVVKPVEFQRFVHAVKD
jgi:response regulator of citrate/malate metabolism